MSEPEVFVVVEAHLVDARINPVADTAVAELRRVAAEAGLTFSQHFIARPGEVRATLAVARALTMENFFKLLALHQVGNAMSPGDLLLRDEVFQSGAGRVVSRWPIMPMVRINHETWGTEITNQEFAGKEVCYCTTIGSEPPVTVVCVDNELPKVGMLGAGQATFRKIAKGLAEFRGEAGGDADL